MPRPRYLILALVLASSAGIAAYGGEGGGTTPPDADSVADLPVVDCESRVQVIPERDDRSLAGLRRKSVFAGAVVFVGAKAYRNDPRRSFRPSPGVERRAVKVRIAVDAERVVTLELAGRTRRHAVIEIGLERKPHRVRGPRVELRACPADATVAGRRVGRRTDFVPSGFRLDGPRCVKLAIEMEGRAEPLARRIAFGRGTCPRSRTGG